MSYMFSHANAFNQPLNDWDVSKVKSLTETFNNSGMDITSYDSTISGWGKLASLQTDVVVGVLGLFYCDSYDSRQQLKEKYNWDFNGDEQNCIFISNGTIALDVPENSQQSFILGNLGIVNNSIKEPSVEIQSENAGQTFLVDLQNLDLVVNDSTLLDFETIQELLLDITLSIRNEVENLKVSVNVTNVNEAPVIINREFESMSSRIVKGSILGNLEPSDPEGDELTFTITSGNEGDAFVIGQNGLLSIDNPNAIEVNDNLFEMDVEMSDGEFTVLEKITASVFRVTSVEDISNQLIIYPNPATDVLFIDFGAMSNESFNIQVFDLGGKRITLQQNENALNISGLNAGLYLLKVFNDEMQANYRFRKD